MDSMRSLNTSLPKAYNGRSAPPQELLQAFRTAALSVTNLYKAAATDQSNSRQEGYQDALDDLLVFLDKENFGLQDGEGWRVRQWINERYERSSTVQQQDSDDEPAEEEKRPRSTSPAETRMPDEDTQPRSQSQPPLSPETSSKNISEETPQSTLFRFTANDSTQQDVQMQSDAGLSSLPAQADPQTTSNVPGPARLDVVPRGSRTTHRHGSRQGTRSANRDFTFTAGTKRKIQFPDFFDISNVTFGREGRDGMGGGGKRGKYA